MPKGFLTFQVERVGPKTNVYSVINGDGVDLGTVSWWAHWRRYVFYPGPHTMWDAECLREIAKFCTEETEIRKKIRKAERELEAKGTCPSEYPGGPVRHLFVVGQRMCQCGQERAPG